MTHEFYLGNSCILPLFSILLSKLRQPPAVCSPIGWINLTGKKVINFLINETPKARQWLFLCWLLNMRETTLVACPECLVVQLCREKRNTIRSTVVEWVFKLSQVIFPKTDGTDME